MRISTSRSGTATSSTGAWTREEYTERQKRKREIFKKYGFRVIELGEEDLTELDDRLPGKLLRYLPNGYRFR